MWNELFNLHRLIKGERNGGKWSNFMIEIDNDWKNKFHSFTSSRRKLFNLILANAPNKKPFRLSKNKKKV